MKEIGMFVSPSESTGFGSIEDLGHFIGGRAVPGGSGRFGDVYHPATGAIRRRVAMATAEEVSEADAVAKAATPGWTTTPPHIRARVLFRFRDLVEQHADQLASIIN